MHAWKEFMQTSCHEEVHKALFEEQEGLCCYCESAVTKTFGHIEHLVPRSNEPRKIYDYDNLALSCDGSSGENRHCGHNKGPDYDIDKFCSPHNLDTASLFHYSNDGYIEPADNLGKQEQIKAAYMIALLNLNCPRLVGKRKRHAQGIINTLGSSPAKEMIEWAQNYYLRKRKEYFSLSSIILAAIQD